MKVIGFISEPIGRESTEIRGSSVNFDKFND